MLQLVLSRAGYGKTEYVFNQIQALLDSGEKNVLLLTPEQYSFVAERRLLSALKEDKVGLVESTTFSRLSSEISRLYGGDRLPVLSKGARAVMMKRAVETVQDEFVLFEKSTANASFISSVLKIYDEMKSCRVDTEDIRKAAGNTDKDLLQKKLYDIALMMDAYDALIEGEYYDSENELTRLYEKLLHLDYFKDRTVFIDGFSGFVAQEYKIIEVMLAQAKKVYITFCTDSYLSRDRYDLFSYVNANIEILRGVTRKAGETFLPPVVLDTNYRAKNEELLAAEKYVFSSAPKVFDKVPQYVRLYCAGSLSNECDRIALEIAKLLRSGMHARDIAVICRDLDKYEKELCFAFDKYNVPYFNDERQSITSQPLMMFCAFLLRTMIYSWRSEDIFSLLKTGLTALDADSVNALENYAYVWNITGSKWKKPFTQCPRGFAETMSDEDAALLKKLNASREYVVSRLEKFQNKCRRKNSADISRALYFTLLDFSCDTQLKALAVSLKECGKSALSDEQGRIWDLLMEMLDTLAVTAEHRPITMKEYYQLFHLMVAGEDLGSVPAGLDNVQLGSADRIRCNNPKAVFIAGANEGEFPQSVTSSGLLSESDRVTLIQNDFKLYSYGETLTAQERYFAYMAVSSPTEKLFVSYRGGNESNSESSIVRGLQTVFPLLQTEYPSGEKSLQDIESDANAFEILAANYEENDVFIRSLDAYFEKKEAYRFRLRAVRTLTENNDIKIENKELSKALFQKNMYLSASRIEEYYNCAFRYFCKFGLGARPLQKAEMDPMQTGTVIHYVLEQIVKAHPKDSLLALSKEEIALLVNTQLETFLKTKMGDTEEFTPRFRYQFMRLSKMLIAVVERLQAEFAQCDFAPCAFELTIGDGKGGEEVLSKELPLPDGGSIRIKGAVDRVDMYEENGKKYIRVVDYKSGKKDFYLSDILYGLNLQMFLYLFALAQSDGDYAGTSGGVLYMHSARSIMNLDRNTNADDIKSKESAQFKMKGLIVNDEEHELARHMEHDLKGKYIPAKFTKKDGLSGNIVTLEELGYIARKINQLIADMGVSLHSGDISQHPVHGKAHEKTCEFCDYRAVCMNRRTVEMREMEEADNQAVLSVLKKECDENA